jgi:hypothetical protein
MPDTSLQIEAEAQQVLNELWSEKLIPFAVNVEKITKAPGVYTIHFYGNRILPTLIVLTKGHSFRNLVRSAVLARVATKKMASLKNWSSNHFLD